MKRIISVCDKLSGGLGRLSAWVILPLIFATVYEVVSRRLFDAPTIWAYEVGYMMTGTSFLFGAAYALRERAHIRIDVLFNRFPMRTKALVDVLGYTLLMLPFGIWLTYKLGVYAHDAYLSGERSGQSAWDPIIWPYRAMFCLGILVLTLQCIAEWLRALRVLFRAADAEEEARTYG